MPFKYLESKGIGFGKRVKKTRVDKALTDDQYRAILASAEASASEFNKNWKRDYAALFLGGALGLRIGEAVLLERKCFERLEKENYYELPTLKQSEKILFECKNPECGKHANGKAKRVRVRWDMGGKEYQCPRCNAVGIVKQPKDAPVTGLKFMDAGFIEEPTVGFILSYMENDMRPDQRWFFESRYPDTHISESYLSDIFSTFAHSAGLPPVYTYHSLRHYRGVLLYSCTKDFQACKEGLRHKDIKTTQIYASLDSELRDEYQKKLNKRAFDPAKKKKVKI